MTTDGTHEWPEPGDWSVAWAEGDVVKWRHGDDRHDRIFNGSTATLWANQRRQAIFEDGVHIFEVDGNEVEQIPAGAVDRSALSKKAETILREHTPDE